MVLDDTVYERYQAAYKALDSDNSRRWVHGQREAGAAYVWGFQDAGGTEKDSHIAFVFGCAWAEVAALFESVRISSRTNIPHAWKLFRDTGEILTPEARAKVKPVTGQ